MRQSKWQLSLSLIQVTCLRMVRCLIENQVLYSFLKVKMGLITKNFKIQPSLHGNSLDHQETKARRLVMMAGLLRTVTVVQGMSVNRVVYTKTLLSQTISSMTHSMESLQVTKRKADLCKWSSTSIS